MSTKLVGILNVTPDSFSDGGKFESLDSAIWQLEKILKEGADIVDIGAESTRPRAIAITSEEEWRRLEKILPLAIAVVKKFNSERGKLVEISIDSYHFATIVKAYELGVKIINDVSGLADEKIIDFIATKNLTTVLMHSLSVPTNPELIINPHLNVVAEIISWAEEKIALLAKKNLQKSQLIFDPGIGFGKNAEQSIRILKSIDLFRILGLPLYVGHSKKSFLDKIDCSNFEGGNGDLTRDQKTLIISKFLAKKNVEFLRVHEVKENLLAIR